MRQKYQTNVPEQTATHGHFDVQMKGDQWAVHDRRTGGWSKGFATYKEADTHAAELFKQHQAQAAQNINAFFNSRGAA